MSLRYAVLGMLSIRLMSGYALKKTMDASVVHFWSADQSQIYRALGDLVDDGWASRTTITQEDRPNRHLHQLTSTGADALDAWLASPPEPVVKREPFLARVFFADRLPPDQIRALLDARRHEIDRQLTELETIETPEVRDSLAEVLRFATLDNGISHARAELAWLDALATQLKDHRS